MKKMFLAAAAAATMMVASPAIAQDDWPLKGGDYWEVTSIKVKDGGGLKYAKWLATEWKRFNDYSKSQGWISDYMILSNVHGRADEADYYLVRKMKSLPDAAEGERRGKAFRAYMQRTIDQLVSESGNRAEYRKVMSSSLLQELSPRN